MPGKAGGARYLAVAHHLPGLDRCNCLPDSLVECFPGISHVCILATKTQAGYGRIRYNNLGHGDDHIAFLVSLFSVGVGLALFQRPAAVNDRPQRPGINQFSEKHQVRGSLKMKEYR